MLLPSDSNGVRYGYVRRYGIGGLLRKWKFGDREAQKVRGFSSSPAAVWGGFLRAGVGLWRAGQSQGRSDGVGLLNTLVLL